jgi:hypothetical protein
MTEPLRKDDESDDEYATRLGTMSMKTVDGHYTDPDGFAVPGLPEPPEGHYWTVHDVHKMANGRTPNYPDPNSPPIFRNPPHDVDLSQPYSNIDLSGVNHFARTVEGQPRACGGCGQPWPCEQASELANVASKGHASLPQGTQFDAAARLLGLTKEDLLAKLKD